MNNSFITSVGKGKYNIEYETTDEQNYQLVEEICRLFIDRSEMFKLQQEIKRLKESEEYHRKGYAELYKRIDDVIKYIENTSGLLEYQEIIEIRDILEGEDVED